MANPGAGERTYEHPSSEDEVRDIVRQCAADRTSLRVIGSAHSEPASIGPIEGRTLMLDKMRQRSIRPGSDPTNAVAEVEAGCHFGKDPHDPTGTSRWSTSLNAFLLGSGHALPDLGGITHQTVGGYLSTGSSGGTTRYSLGDAIERIRFVDGTGQIHEVSSDDPDPKQRDLFHAVGVSMGLLGVITKVWFRLEPSYAIAGQQITRRTADVNVDFFGDKPSSISFQDYLREAPYARLMWWPQSGFDRMVVWQAQRMAPPPGFTPKPYQAFGRAGRVASLAGSALFTVIGNLDDLRSIPEKLSAFYAELDAQIDGEEDPNGSPRLTTPRTRVSRDEVLAHLRSGLRRGLERSTRPTTDASTIFDGTSILERLEPRIGSVVGKPFANIVSDVLVALVRLAMESALDGDLAREVGRWIRSRMPDLIDGILDPFVSLDEAPQIFQDSWMSGLPMDNQMDDLLWPTVFTELWIPLHRAQSVMSALRDFYAAGGDERLSHERTGTFACEIYAAKRSPFWLSPSFDADVVRLDFFWFGKNAADPRATFFPRFWELLEPFEFRPHWGKVLPRPTERYADYYRSVFPRLRDFLTLRDRLDPAGVFATPYWRDHLGF